MSKRPTNFRNPLGYFCAPNGAGPDYVAERDFERFVAFGLLVCHDHILGLGCEKIDGDTADVYWLRKNFLDTVELAIDALPTMIQECQEWDDDSKASLAYQGDQCEGSVNVPLKREHWEGESRDDNELRYQWCFERLDMSLADGNDDPCLLFTLNWGEADDFAIWLRLDAVYGERKGKPRLKPLQKALRHVKSVIAQANAYNEANQGEMTRPQYDDDDHGNVEASNV